MKKRPKKIVVAVDFSPFSKPAVSYAADLAPLFEKHLVLINVIDQRALEKLQRWGLKVGTGNGDRFIRSLIKQRENRLEAMVVETRRLDIPTEIQVRVDTPFRGILAGVKDFDASLLIIGTKGRTNLRDVLVGSCAEKLFHRNPVPVLSIPATYINSRKLTDG